MKWCRGPRRFLPGRSSTELVGSLRRRRRGRSAVPHLRPRTLSPRVPRRATGVMPRAGHAPRRSGFVELGSPVGEAGLDVDLGRPGASGALPKFDWCLKGGTLSQMTERLGASSPGRHVGSLKPWPECFQAAFQLALRTDEGCLFLLFLQCFALVHFLFSIFAY